MPRAGLDDLFEDPKSHQMLRMLRIVREKGPMNMRTFTFYAEMAPRHSDALRDDLEARGLLQVGTPAIRKKSDVEIRITQEGESLLGSLADARAIAERAHRNAKRGAEDPTT